MGEEVSEGRWEWLERVLWRVLLSWSIVFSYCTVPGSSVVAIAATVPMVYVHMKPENSM